MSRVRVRLAAGGDAPALQSGGNAVGRKRARPDEVDGGCAPDAGPLAAACRYCATVKEQWSDYVYDGANESVHTTARSLLHRRVSTWASLIENTMRK